jgi:glycerophosphoryl diester phosphodiesterase
MRIWRGMAIVIAFLAALYVYFGQFHPHERVADHVFFEKPGPWAIAHQGGRRLWPENTLYAFEHADALGVDVLEMDLRVTKDGNIVVMHDATVDRTTNGSGRVDTLSFAVFGELDAGYRFESDSSGFPFRGQGLHVPSLEDVLKRFDAKRLILEMKQFTPELAIRLCDMLTRHRASERILVASFSHGSMRAFRQACPSVATSATMREAILLYQLERMHLASLYRSPAVALQIPESFRDRRVLGPELIELAAAYNVHIQVWTVNEEADMKRLLDMGVQGIMTDVPDRLLQLMGRPKPALNSRATH